MKKNEKKTKIKQTKLSCMLIVTTLPIFHFLDLVYDEEKIECFKFVNQCSMLLQQKWCLLLVTL